MKDFIGKSSTNYNTQLLLLHHSFVNYDQLKNSGKVWTYWLNARFDEIMIQIALLLCMAFNEIHTHTTRYAYLDVTFACLAFFYSESLRESNSAGNSEFFAWKMISQQQCDPAQVNSAGRFSLYLEFRELSGFLLIPSLTAKKSVYWIIKFTLIFN